MRLSAPIPAVPAGAAPGFPALTAPARPAPALVAIRGLSEEQGRGVCNSLADQAIAIVNSVETLFAGWEANGLDPEAMSKKLGSMIPDKLATARTLISTVLNQCEGSLSDDRYREIEEASDRLAGLRGKLGNFAAEVNWDAVGDALQRTAEVAAGVVGAVFGAVWTWLQDRLRQAI